MISRRGFFAVLTGVLAAPKALWSKAYRNPDTLESILLSVEKWRRKNPGLECKVILSGECLAKIRNECSGWSPIPTKASTSWILPVGLEGVFCGVSLYRDDSMNWLDWMIVEK